MGTNCCNCAEPTSGTLSKRKTATLYGVPLLSFAMLLAGLLLTWFKTGFFEKPHIAFCWYVLAYLPVGIPVIKEAWEAILQKDIFNEFTLMTLATLGAFYIGEYPEGVAVMLFYTVGEIFQDKAVGRAKKNISALLDVRPETATIVHAGNRLSKVTPPEVKVGEIIEIKAGERIPLDGKLCNEIASFDTAALTGESVPRILRQGETVLAGMIVTDSVIRMEVTAPYNQSTLARILELVQNASARKAPTELFIRKFARIYTPIITALALLIVLGPWLYAYIQPAFLFNLHDWLYRALIFLVISCPCALVVSIPLGYFGGIGAASRRGILFKGGNYLDALTQVNTLVFDKTGTLTEGLFSIECIESTGTFSKEKLLELIASVEKQSNHPIAKAIVNHAAELQLTLERPANLTEIAGYGMEATLGGKHILAGNIHLLEKKGIPFPASLQRIPETIVVCAVDKKYSGYVLLTDSVKPDAAAAIRELKKSGIKNMLILSGDKQALVTKLARELGISQAYGDLLPQEKANRLEALKKDKNNRVAFVGDGMNDGPVLALSDVGIAMGGVGSDVAIESADVVIQTDRLSLLPVAIRLGKQTRRIIWENIALAFSVKWVVLLLGACGIATLWEAVFADVGVALLAILNAIRILR